MTDDEVDALIAKRLSEHTSWGEELPGILAALVRRIRALEAKVHRQSFEPHADDELTGRQQIPSEFLGPNQS